jgi:phosphate transport system substrate-binding protein
MPWVQVRNGAGKYVEASLERTSAAADVPTLPDNMEILLTDSANAEAYPISGFTWLLLYENQKDPARADAVVRMAWWMTHDAQKYATPLEYAPLKGEAVKKTESLLKKININGKPALATN